MLHLNNERLEGRKGPSVVIIILTHSSSSSLHLLCNTLYAKKRDYISYWKEKKSDYYIKTNIFFFLSLLVFNWFIIISIFYFHTLRMKAHISFLLTQELNERKIAENYIHIWHNESKGKEQNICICMYISRENKLILKK